MSEKEQCINVFLGDVLGETLFANIAQRAVEGWKSKGIDELQLQHSLRHIFPGIWPCFAAEEEILEIRQQAGIILGVDESLIQIDGIRSDGLVNLFVNW